MKKIDCKRPLPYPKEVGVCSPFSYPLLLNFYTSCGHANKFKAQPNPSVYEKRSLYTVLCFTHRHDKEKIVNDPLLS